jgi:hypothetical protein
MALSDNPFIGVDVATLQQLQADYLQVLTDIAKTGKSYAFPGLSLTRADIPEVKKTLSELRIAIDAATGRAIQVAYATVRTDRKFTGSSEAGDL